MTMKDHLTIATSAEECSNSVLYRRIRTFAQRIAARRGISVVKGRLQNKFWGLRP